MRFILFFFTAAAMGVAALAQDTNLHTNVHELYLQDQGDRGVGGGKAVTNWQDLVTRDNARRGRVRDYLLAHVLASVAVAKGDSKSLWISAASLDRYLQLIGQTQVFGTQYQSKDDKPYTQEAYNRTLIPDALRLVFCVPSLKQQKSNVADFNAGKYPAGILPAGCQR
ncbi:MAG: hypothetical protein DMG30_07860 [Acidobacteria bacterium]|nr:MAG: hypothetical protein DMG30_07860 [Acidobacteriota bacterium]